MGRNTRVINAVGAEQPTTGHTHADVVGNDTVKTLGALNDRTTKVVATLEAADVRVTFDGQDPVNALGSEVGHHYFDGAVFEMNRNTALAMKVLEHTAGSNYVLRVTEFE